MELNDLLNRQQEIGKTIEQMASNFKKDSLARKTSEYADKRMKSLTALWKEFTLNHARLVKADIRHDQEPYFIENYFEEMEKLQSRFRSWLTDIGGPSQQMGYSSGASNEVVHEPLRPADGAGQQMLERLFRKQNNLELTIKYYLAAIDREGDQVHSSHYYQLKIERLLAYENDLKEIVNLIMEESSEDILENIEKSHELQRQLQDKIVDLQQRLDLPQSIMGSQHVSLHNRIKLPKLTLPVFDGDYLLWTQFHDLYVQLIHTQPLSNTEKMFYLASNLSGEARALIRHLSVTSDNYETAWNIIVSRYNNTRLIVTATLNKLLNQPPINSDCANDVKSLHDVTKECYLALKNRQISVDTWNPILLHLLLKKLDKNTHTLYEQSLENPKEFGDLEDFLQFLEGRFHTLETVQRDEISKRQRPPGHQKSKSVLTASTQQDCLCTPQQHHRLFHCKEFLSLKPDKRVQYLIKTSRCLNCLKTGHFANQCTSRGCLKCNKKHNTLVHVPELSKKKQPMATTLSEPPSSTNTATLTTNIERAKSGYVLLGTAAVRISIGENKFITCKALLDSGSQINIVTEKLARKLGIEQTQNSVVIEGVGNTVQRVSGRINVHVTSTSTNFAVHMEAFVLKKITGIQPADHINTQSWPIPTKFQLADANFNQPGRIDLLIGAEFYHQLMLPEKHTMSPELPILQNSLLGWIVTGKVVDSDIKANDCNICTACDTDTNLSKQIERFWRLEETNMKHHFTESEERCERQFKQETSRNDQGRFVVRLPFKEETDCLGESKDTALRRFFALERRLAANTDVKKQYVEFMNEYLQLNHMKPVKMAELSPPYYFLPHHFVCKPDSTTTKLRVVFDASAKTTTNISLNDVLAKGPVIQDELFSILLRFRMPRFVFTGDIEKMYRQVLLHDDDQRYQLIFWRNDAEEELKCYQLTTITYGTTSAPYLAIKSLQTLGEQRSKQYPLGSKVVKRGFYVDDVMTGSDSITEAFQMQTELIALLKEGGFRLRKWCANHPRLLERFQPQDMEVVLNFNDYSEERIKTLGLTWCPKQDVFKVKPHVPVRDRITKRTAYSDIAHIFDPLGILSPVVVTAKLLLQQMWTLKSDWDDQLPSQLELQWREFRSSLDHLKEFAFPRHVFDHHLPKNIQLHTFADASEKAFGAAVYVRFFTKDNLLLVRLLCAKSKVAPTKKETIPRLELCAAKLAADLCNRVKADLDLGSVEEFYWTDSTIVLAWLNQPSSSQQTFVANRVAAIQRMTVAKNWRHVESQENPADVLSRGTTPSKFKNFSIWFYGPVFLHGAESSWPPAYSPHTIKALPVALTPELASTIKGIEHGNSFAKLQRILAYVIRFSKRSRRVTNHQEHLTPEELEIALYMLVKSMQQEEFANDIRHLQRSAEPTKDSALHGLTPFIDEHGIIRVGGRLQEAQISFDAKHPMLLPYMHPITKMIMVDLHLKNCHAPPQTLLSITRQKFWPIKGKILARSIVHHCVRCAKSTPKLQHQILGNLPPARIQPARPFITSGVDFCGPFWTHFRVRGKQPVKSYIAIFCCFATKAVHLEVVTDLTTNAFLGALSRFISRRGHVKDIYSDNATNFVGANNHLHEVYESIYSANAKEQITNTCAKKGITFHFIPPRAPHFGGLWEAAVKSTKRLMREQLRSASLTYEELETLVVQIEAILNSRPLTPMSEDPNDLTPLTPGHFLIGEPLVNNVDPTAAPFTAKLDKRWEAVRQIRNAFWQKWSKEYLHLLQKRQKWKDGQSNIEPGTVVMVHEDNTPPLRWPLGRIIGVHKGPDNRVRVVDIKTATQTIKRPIHKIALLPIEMHDTKSPIKHEAEPLEETSKNLNHSNEDAPPRKKRLKLGSVVTTILLACLIVPNVRGSNIEIETFNETRPTVYFENLGRASIISSEWEIVVYYNMTSYWKEYTTLTNATNILSDLCGKLVEPGPCTETVRRIQQQLKKLAEDDALMLHKPISPRVKRGALNIVGNVANSLFGVLDSDYADKMEKIIDDTTTNQQRLFHLLKNQTSILDSTVNIMRSNYNRINEHFHQLTALANTQMEKLNHIDQEVHQQKLFAIYMSHAFQLFIAANDLQQTHNALLDTVMDAHHGKVNLRILSPQQLLQELRTIRSQLPKALTLALPDDDIAQFYKLMTIKAKPGSKYTIVQLKIPLESNDEFELYRPIPIPALINEEMWIIKLATPYIIVSLHKDQYYPLENFEQLACKHASNNHLFCNQQHPIYKAGFGPNQCEISLFNRETDNDSCKLQLTPTKAHWIQLFASNKWLFSLSTRTTINGVCNGEPTQLMLHGSGIITLRSGCIIKQPRLTIQYHTTYSSIIQRSYTASINFTAPSTDPPIETATVPQMPNIPINELDNMHKKLKDQEVVDDSIGLNQHHIHHYSVGYLALGLTLSTIILIYCKFAKRDPSRHKPSAQPASSFRIEPDTLNES